MVFAIHQHQSATGIHVFPTHPKHLPTYLPLLGCPGALTLGAWLHALNLDWSSIWGAFMLFTVVVPVYSPKQCPFSPHSLHLLLSFLRLTILTGIRAIPLCGFELHFPGDDQCWASFMYLLAVCMSSGKCLFRSSAHFLIRLFFDSAIYCSCNKKVEKLGQRVRTWNWWKNYFIFIHHGLIKAWPWVSICHMMNLLH